MHVRLALVIGIAFFGACQADRPQVKPDTPPTQASEMFVTLPRLARRLSLEYHGEDGGLIELSAPPDHVMLVEQSRQVMVNGRKLHLEYPCIRRGEEFAVRSEDAARVRDALKSQRSARKHSTLRKARPKAPRAQVLPAAWRPEASQRAWRYIVIHHQAAAEGSAAVIHRAHVRRGMDGLGYHFVVGNGSGTPDGRIEVGYRWRRQIHGAHARVRPGDDNRWNEYGIGICLVGDFRYTAPTREQLDSLVRLVRYMRRAYGIAADHVVPHDFVKPTICPGPKFPWAEFLARIR